MGAPSEAERAVHSARAELYGLPQAEFTAARSALARSLRDAGAREAAAEVARLPKPTSPRGPSTSSHATSPRPWPS